MENQSSDSQMVENTINKRVEEARSHWDKFNPLKAEELIRMLIEYIGDDPNREGVKDTPRRVVKSYKELFSGYHIDPKIVLGTTFDGAGYDQMVICKDIEFYSHCEHHMNPFFGKVHVGYIPGERVVGLSKLARLVEVFSRRLQIQEKMTQQIADTINDVLLPAGVIVIVEAKHMCMCARGVGKQNSSMVTSAIHGVLKDASVRSEFLSLVNLS